MPWLGCVTYPSRAFTSTTISLLRKHLVATPHQPHPPCGRPMKWRKQEKQLWKEIEKKKTETKNRTVDIRCSRSFIDSLNSLLSSWWLFSGVLGAHIRSKLALAVHLNALLCFVRTLCVNHWRLIDFWALSFFPCFWWTSALRFVSITDRLLQYLAGFVRQLWDWSWWNFLPNLPLQLLSFRPHYFWFVLTISSICERNWGVI